MDRGNPAATRGYPLGPGVRGYFQWQKALWDSAELRSYYADHPRRRIDLRAVAQVIALHGENGRGCFATAKTIAHIVGCSVHTAKDLRKLLIDMGWLTVVSRTAGSTRRAMAVSISLPGAQPAGSSNGSVPGGGNGSVSQFEHCPQHGPYAPSYGKCPVCGPDRVLVTASSAGPPNGSVTTPNGSV